MKNKEIVDIMMSLIDKNTFTPKMNGFARYIGKSGFILVSAYSGADQNNEKFLLKRFPDIGKIVEMCRSHIKDDFCRVVTGAYMIGLTASEIEIGCKQIGIWKK